MCQFWFILKNENFKETFQQNITIIYQESLQNKMSVALKVRLSSLMGPFLNFLVEHNLLTDQLQQILLSFYKECFKRQIEIKTEKSFEMTD